MESNPYVWATVDEYDLDIWNRQLRYRNTIGFCLVVFAILGSQLAQVFGGTQKKPLSIQETFSIGNELQLFLDDELIELMHDVDLRLHSPRRKEIVIAKDKPWEDSTMFDPVV